MPNELDMLNEWRPNWKDERAYFTRLNKDTSNETYAWEFLRRNPTYQLDFLRNEDAIKRKKFRRLKRRVVNPDNELFFYYSEDMRDWYGLAAHSDNYDPRIDTPPTFYRLEYPYFIEPIKLESSGPNDFLTFPRTYAYDQSLPGEFQVCMSTHVELEKQLLEIKNFYEKYWSKPETSHGKEYYITYLRILDALHINVSKKELYAIYPNIIDEQMLTHHIRIAKELQKGRYIRIVKSKIFCKRPKKLIKKKTRLPKDSGLLHKICGEENIIDLACIPPQFLTDNPD